MAAAVPEPATEVRLTNSSPRVCPGMLAIMAIASLQRAWKLFANPITFSMHVVIFATMLVALAFFRQKRGWYRFDLSGRSGPVAFGSCIVL